MYEQTKGRPLYVVKSLNRGDASVRESCVGVMGPADHHPPARKRAEKVCENAAPSIVPWPERRVFHPSSEGGRAPRPPGRMNGFKGYNRDDLYRVARIAGLRIRHADPTKGRAIEAIRYHGRLVEPPKAGAIGHADFERIGPDYARD